MAVLGIKLAPFIHLCCAYQALAFSADHLSGDEDCAFKNHNGNNIRIKKKIPFSLIGLLCVLLVISKMIKIIIID